MLSSLGIKTPLNEIPLLGPLLFVKYKIIEIFTKLSLTGDKFMPEMHLKQPEFTYSACGTLSKSKERIQKFKESGDSRYISQIELDIV